MPLHHRNSNGVIHPSSSLAETQPQTTLSFVTSPQIPLYTRFLTFLRLFYLFLIAENPLWWSFRQGARNKQADLEGPYYVVGAPDRTIARGKAALASLNDLQAAPTTFLLVLTVLTPSGAPIPNVLVDFWQADATGVYAFDTYALRGTARTDSHGRLELLTVPPGRYGPASHLRAGHFHFRLVAPAPQGVPAGKDALNGDRYAALATQVYLCQRNDFAQMGTDFLNFFRAPRPGNKITAYCIPSSAPVASTAATPTSEGSTRFMDLPEFDTAAQPELAASVKWWNDVLTRSARGLKVGAMGEKQIQMDVLRQWCL